MGVCAGAWLGGDEGSVMGVCARARLGSDERSVIGAILKGTLPFLTTYISILEKK